MRKIVDTILPTTMVGSYPRPDWFKYQLLGRDARVAFKHAPHEEAYADATRVILEAGGDPELANDRGQTPLAGAAFKNDIAIARLLLARGAAVDGTGTGSRTALMTAAMFDRTEMVALLLEHGADPDFRDAAGQSAADMARAMGAQATPGQLDAAARKTG